MSSHSAGNGSISRPSQPAYQMGAGSRTRGPDLSNLDRGLYLRADGRGVRKGEIRARSQSRGLGRQAAPARTVEKKVAELAASSAPHPRGLVDRVTGPSVEPALRAHQPKLHRRTADLCRCHSGNVTNDVSRARQERVQVADGAHGVGRRRNRRSVA